jgi:hypothetical protein
LAEAELVAQQMAHQTPTKEVAARHLEQAEQAEAEAARLLADQRAEVMAAEAL